MSTARSIIAPIVVRFIYIAFVSLLFEPARQRVTPHSAAPSAIP
jgi:hypothetical protein